MMSEDEEDDLKNSEHQQLQEATKTSLWAWVCVRVRKDYRERARWL